MGCAPGGSCTYMTLSNQNRVIVSSMPFSSIIDKHQHMHFFTFNTVLV